MKKYFLNFICIAAAILTASCTRVEAPDTLGAEADVTFKVTTPQLATRAIGDGTTATNLYYGVYSVSTDANNTTTYTRINEISKTSSAQTINNRTTTVSLKLVNGKKYALLFWAANPNSVATVDWGNITMSYNPTTANTEAYDAFYHYEEFIVTGAINKDISLKRPFAQINIGTNDMVAATAAGMTVEETALTVEDVYTGMDLKTGDVTGNPTSVTYASSSVSAFDNEEFPVAGNKYMTMNYILVNEEKELTSITMTFKGDDGVEYTRNYYQVPVQRNYRTNIYGSILTDEANYKVTIEPEFDGEKNREIAAVTTGAGLVDVLQNGGKAQLQNNITFNDLLTKSVPVNAIRVNKSVVIDLNGYTLTHNGGQEVNGDIAIRVDNGGYVEFIGTKEGSKVIAEYGYIASANDGGVIVVDGGHYEAELTTFQANGGKVYIKGGEFKVNLNHSDPKWGTEYLLNHIDDENQNGLIEVTGGKFYKYDPANSDSEDPEMNFVKAGYSSVKEEDSEYYVVSEGVKNQVALEALIAEGGEVTLTDDVQLETPLLINNDVTINLNGKTITAGTFAESNGVISEGDTDSYVFWVKEGTLTLEGNGEVIADDAKYSIAVWADGGNVIINGGNYKNLHWGDLIYAKNGGNIVINGGSFVASNNGFGQEEGTQNEYSALNIHGSLPGTITVTGGSFYKFDPANNASENPAMNFVAEGYKSVQDGDYYVVVEGSVDVVASTDEGMEEALGKNEKDVVIVLGGDVTVDVAAWATEEFGGDKSETITIDGNGHTITFNQTNSDWNNITTANGAKLIIKNAHITNTGYNDGPWNRHDLNFNCHVVLTNVTSDKAIALKSDATLTNVTINDKNTSDTYAMWIQPNGQTVTLSNCLIDMIDCSDGRGIKIDEQYVDTPGKVTLKVSNTVFKTEEKSAIIVKSKAGADIKLSNVDITNVQADNTNAVWVDEASEVYYDLVNVVGGTKILEP